jgi:kynurenine formamidase
LESVYSLSNSSHTGTRVDSPKHFSLMAKVSKRFDLRPLLVDLQFWKWDGTGTTVSDLDGDASDVLVGDIILLYTGRTITRDEILLASKNLQLTGL